MTSYDTQHGSSAKFSGSGGAVIGVCLDQTKKVSHMVCVHLLEVASKCNLICFLKYFTPQCKVVVVKVYLSGDQHHYHHKAFLHGAACR